MKAYAGLTDGSWPAASDPLSAAAGPTRDGGSFDLAPANSRLQKER